MPVPAVSFKRRWALARVCEPGLLLIQVFTKSADADDDADFLLILINYYYFKLLLLRRVC